MKDIIKNRLLKNYKHKSKWAKKNKIEAYRLYDRDIPDFPFIADIYKDQAIIYFKGNPKIDDKKNHYPIFLEALKEVCSLSDEYIYYKNRFIQDKENKYTKEDTDPIKFEVREGQYRFIVSLNKYLDSGLFLDHRPLRNILSTSHYKSVLNLFCYTGSLSVCSARVDNQVTSVDLSNTYLEWAKDNFRINNLETDRHNFIRTDVFKYLETNKNKVQYDLIILDPPTFSQSKAMENTLDIQKDHLEIVKNCMSMLKQDGKMYFSNNLRDFKLNETISEKYKVIDLTKRSIPEDFRDQKIHKLFEIRHCIEQ